MKRSHQIDSLKNVELFIILQNKRNLETRFARILVFCFASGSALKKVVKLTRLKNVKLFIILRKKQNLEARLACTIHNTSKKMELRSLLRSHPCVLFCIWISFEKKVVKLTRLKNVKLFIILGNKWKLETRFARILVFSFASASALKKKSSNRLG